MAVVRDRNGIKTANTLISFLKQPAVSQTQFFESAVCRVYLCNCPWSGFAIRLSLHSCLILCLSCTSVSQFQ